MCKKTKFVVRSHDRETGSFRNSAVLLTLFSSAPYCLHCSVLHCTVYTVQHCTILFTLFSTALYCIHCSELPCTVYTVQHCTVLYTLFSTALYCLHWLALHCTMYGAVLNSTGSCSVLRTVQRLSVLCTQKLRKLAQKA